MVCHSWGVSTQFRIPPLNSIDTATFGGGPAQKDGRGAATPWHAAGASACASATPNYNRTGLHELDPDPLAPETQLPARATYAGTGLSIPPCEGQRFPVLSSRNRNAKTLGLSLVSESVSELKITHSKSRNRNRNSDIPSLGTGIESQTFQVSEPESKFNVSRIFPSITSPFTQKKPFFK